MEDQTPNPLDLFEPSLSHLFKTCKIIMETNESSVNDECGDFMWDDALQANEAKVQSGISATVEQEKVEVASSNEANATAIS